MVVHSMFDSLLYCNEYLWVASIKLLTKTKVEVTLCRKKRLQIT